MNAEYGRYLRNKCGWSVIMTNRIAFAFATVTLGAANNKQPKKWAALVEDFVTALLQHQINGVGRSYTRERRAATTGGPRRFQWRNCPICEFRWADRYAGLRLNWI